MAYVLNEEQTLLKDSAKSFLNDQAPVSQLRELRDSKSEKGYDEQTWQQMAEMGWAGLTIPEAYGGLDFGYIGFGQILEQSGRTLTASPLLASALFASNVILQCGSEEQKKNLLPMIAEGSKIFTVAIDEGNRHNPESISTSLQAENGSFSLTGQKTMVIDGHVADHILVVCKNRSGETSVAIVDQGVAGLTINRQIMMDSRNMASLTMDQVKVSTDQVLGSGELQKGVTRALDITRIGIAAEMLGLAREAFDRTLAYIKERKQFGVPIGSFQGLQHRAADMYCELEMCQSLVANGLTAIDENQDNLNVLASATKAKLSQIVQLVTNEAVQFYGGIGMTDDEEIGFFLKRARVTMALLGDHNFHLDRFGALQGY